MEGISAYQETKNTDDIPNELIDLMICEGKRINTNLLEMFSFEEGKLLAIEYFLARLNYIMKTTTLISEAHIDFCRKSLNQMHPSATALLELDMKNLLSLEDKVELIFDLKELLDPPKKEAFVISVFLIPGYKN